MSAKCAGELLWYFKYREPNSHFPSSRRSTAYWLVIVSINASGNSVHNLVCSYHLRTSPASFVLQKGILLGHCCLWTCSNSQLHLPNHQYKQSKQSRPLRNLVCANSRKPSLDCARGWMLTQLKIAPLFTNAFVYMVMGELWLLMS